MRTLHRRTTAITGALALWVVAGGVWAQAAAPGASVDIYVCTDDQGRRITADRPIRECMDRPQRILNPDGSLRGICVYTVCDFLFPHTAFLVDWLLPEADGDATVAEAAAWAVARLSGAAA